MTRPWEFKSGAFWEIKPDMISRERSAVPLDSNNSSKTLGGTSVTSELKTGIFPFTVKVKVWCQTAKMTWMISEVTCCCFPEPGSTCKRWWITQSILTTVFLDWILAAGWANLAKEVANTWSYERLMRSLVLALLLLERSRSFWSEARPCISINSVPRKSSKSLSSLLTIIFHDLLRNHLLTRVQCTWTWQSNAVRVTWQTFSCEVFVCLSDQKSTSAVPCHQL